MLQFGSRDANVQENRMKMCKLYRVTGMSLSTYHTMDVTPGDLSSPKSDKESLDTLVWGDH